MKVRLKNIWLAVSFFLVLFSAQGQCWFDDLRLDLSSNSATQEFKDFIKTADGSLAYKILHTGGKPQLRKSKEALEAVANLRNNPSFSQMELTDAIIGGIQGSQNLSYVDVLTTLDNFGNALQGKNISLINFERVLSDLNRGANFTEGAEWTVRYLVNRLNSFSSGKIAFEVTETWNDAGNVIRRVDMIDETNSASKIYYEFKSVQNVPPGKFGDQFIKDLSNPDVNSLDQLKWLFDGRKNPDNFRDNMLDAIDELNLTEDLAEKFTQLRDIEQFRDAIKSEFDEIFELAN